MEFPEPETVVPDPQAIGCYCLEYEGDNPQCPQHGKAVMQITACDLVACSGLVVIALVSLIAMLCVVF